MRPFQAAALRVRIVIAWIRLRVAEIQLHSIAELIGSDLGKPIPHEQRRVLLLRRCFAELAADVRRQEYLDALALMQDCDAAPAACIRRSARGNP